MVQALDSDKAYVLNGKTFWARVNEAYGSWELFESRDARASEPVFIVGGAGQLLIWPAGTPMPLATPWTLADLREATPQEDYPRTGEGDWRQEVPAPRPRW